MHFSYNIYSVRKLSLSCIYNHFCFRIGLLDKWKERNGPTATYRQLAKCLHKAEVIDSVHILCIELGAPKDAA